MKTNYTGLFTQVTLRVEASSEEEARMKMRDELLVYVEKMVDDRLIVWED